jgi:hypothetical protein
VLVAANHKVHGTYLSWQCCAIAHLTRRSRSCRQGAAL